MARFVLAGRADCPHYAKAEHLADLLHRALPHFSIHYICIHPPAWQEWLEATCRANGWSHQQSPLVWRELIHRGGKALYLGGFTDFMEHCQEYYSITSDMSTEVMLKIAEENLESKVKLMEEEERRLSLVQPRHIWIAGALNPTCQSLLPHLLSSELFPQPQVSTSIRPHPPSSEEFPQVSTSISLHLLDLEAEVEVLRGLRMEIQDLALPLLHQVSVHVDLERAFQDADLIILLDDRWPEEGDAQSEEEDDKTRTKKKDLRRISARYEAYGRLMEQRAHREVMVLVAGDTLVNLKCSLLLDHAPSIHSWRFVAVATQLEYEARAHVARKLGVRPSDVTDVMVWGNISGSSYVDLQRAQVFNYDGAIKGPAFFSRAVLEVLHDRKWLNTDLPALVGRQRAATVTSRGQRTGSMSATNAILHVLKAWSQTSSKPEQLLSLGVLCPGQYELPEGVVLSLPVTFKEGRWSELFDLTMMGHDLRGALQRCAEELKQERILCFQACYEDSLKTTVPADPQPSLLT